MEIQQLLAAFQACSRRPVKRFCLRDLTSTQHRSERCSLGPLNQKFGFGHVRAQLKSPAQGEEIMPVLSLLHGSNHVVPGLERRRRKLAINKSISKQPAPGEALSYKLASDIEQAWRLPRVTRRSAQHPHKHQREAEKGPCWLQISLVLSRFLGHLQRGRHSMQVEIAPNKYTSVSNGWEYPRYCFGDTHLPISLDETNVPGFAGVMVHHK